MTHSPSTITLIAGEVLSWGIVSIEGEWLPLEDGGRGPRDAVGVATDGAGG